MKKNMKKIMALLLTVTLSLGLYGCGSKNDKTESGTSTAAESDTSAAATDGSEKKTLVIGDTTFNPSNEELDVNPHNSYSGWACIRYGIGETLAKEWENTDPLTWKITLQDNVTFSSGRAMDAEAVKQCLEHLLANHDRAAADTKIDSMEADGQVLTIHTSEPKPALLNYLGDPYGCIIDVDAGFDDGIVAGTGPYIATDCQSGDHLTLVKNENYWNGTPHIDELTIKTITDGNTLANALLSGEIQAAYGMAYESYPMFENDNFTFSQISTSRCFFLKMNFNEGSVCTDPAVRKAIAMGIDKEGFVENLLEGNGYPANGTFPAGSAFGGDKVTTETYDAEGAKKVLEEAGWTDTDGDGIREKDGQKLQIKWLTYPSRQELPLLAESAQATLKDIGIDVDINCTADNNSVVQDTAAWDVYAMANVQAPTGDPEYWFTVFATSDATKNQGAYKNEKLDQLEEQLSQEFDPDKRAKLAVEMQQMVLDDNAFVYYQVTADLDIN